MKETRTQPANIDVKMKAMEPSFQDWAQFVSFQPQLYFRPQNLDELKGFFDQYF